LRWLWFGSELLAPVLEPLLWQALCLAILPLIQVASLPRLMMRPPERLTLSLPRSMLLRHLVLSICKIDSENRSWSAATEQVCEKWTVTNMRRHSLILFGYFPDISKKFPDVTRREFGWKPLNLLACPALRTTEIADFRKIPCSFPC
jgi:hypothetical protein